MSKQITVLAIARAKPGMEAELGKRLLAMVEPSRTEEGCISYDMHQSNEDPAIWMAYETWRSDGQGRSSHERLLRQPDGYGLLLEACQKRCL